MRWEQTEFLLKGIYLGLLLMVALHAPDWADVAKVGAFTFGGLALALVAAAWQKMREGYRARGRWFGFLLFLLLENPGMVYTGLIAGLAVGASTTFKGRANDWAVLALAGGAVLGIVFYFLRTVRDRDKRFWLAFGLVAAVVGGAFYLVLQHPNLIANERFMLGVLLLTGIPGFYLLTFSSLVEESEIEIAAICAALGAGLCFLGPSISPNFGVSAIIVPVFVYYYYTRRILPGLRVFKHTLRGLSYSKVGNYRAALVSLNRALQLDPNYALARNQLWQLHRQMDIDKLKSDPETLALVNYDLCLERVAWLLLLDKPKPEQIQEAQRLLELVASQRPALEPRCAYWRAVAHLHERHVDQAAQELESVLNEPSQDSPARRAVLFSAWQLALVLHPEMHKRVAVPLLAQPRRRMEAIAAVERQLALKADDQPAWELKRLLYAPLTENDYDSAVLPDQSALDFDHGYAQQLGLALVENKDQWQRGCEYLRMAARGLTTQATNIYILIAKSCDRYGDAAGLWHNYRRALQVGRKVGVAALKEEDRTALFEVAKQLGEHAMKEGNVDSAIDAFKFYSQYDRAGVETYRTLAQLFERKAEKAADAKQKQDNLFLALHCTEHALSYQGSGNDKDLLQRKDKYCYSIAPEEIKARWQQIYKWFDIEYCLQKTRWVLEKYNGDLDLLDWASHLADVAQAAQPERIAAKLLRARIRRQRGDINDAVGLLEEIRQNKPEKFGSQEEEESWYFAHRLLGDLYIDEKPDQAVLCFQEFRKSDRAGADSLYKLGRAYENLGDHARAAKAYEAVTAFEDHPLVYEARDGLARVRGANNPVG
ncbi:MAG: tetratricopeptide repeat protein [Gemmataceae bacterium]|nr:tetratricopeptide repeat protein [Gemmataceae bacterium]